MSDSTILSEINDFAKGQLRKTSTSEKDVMPTAQGKFPVLNSQEIKDKSFT